MTAAKKQSSKARKDAARYFFIAQIVTRTKTTVKELIQHSTEELEQMYQGLEVK